MGRSCRPRPEPEGRDHDPRRRQVRGLRRLVQEPERSAVSRRIQAPSAGQHPLDRSGGARGSPTASGCSTAPHGILVPGGLRRSRHPRNDEGGRRRAHPRTPYFGICYGFQWAAVEYARHVGGASGADSTEMTPDAPHRIIYKLRDLLGVDDLGGTMRLGSYECQLKPGLACTSAVRSVRDSRAPPAPLRVQLPVRARADRQGARNRRAAPPTASSSRSSKSRPTRGSSPSSSIRSSSRSRSTPHPLFAGFVEASINTRFRVRSSRFKGWRRIQSSRCLVRRVEP